MSKTDKAEADHYKKQIRTRIEGKISDALLDWRGRISEKKFQKIVKRAAKSLAKELVARRKHIKLPATKDRTERRLASANN